MYKPKMGENGQDAIPRGMVPRNRKLAERLEKKMKEKIDQ